MSCPCRAPTLRGNVTQGAATLALGYNVLRLQRVNAAHQCSD